MRKFQYRYYMKCERLSPGVNLPNEAHKTLDPILR